MTQHGLTKQQREAMDFIEGYIEDRGYSPTYREIATGLGLSSTSSVHRLMRHLTERGFVSHLPSKARSIVVVAQDA